MLVLITHPGTINEIVEAPELEDPCRYVAPWEDVQTRTDGSRFVTRDGVDHELEPYTCEHTGETAYRTVSAWPSGNPGSA